MYDFKSKQYKKIYHNKEICNSPYILSINGEIHLIGGADNNYHLIWDEHKEKFDEIYHFNEWTAGNHSGALFHVIRQNKLYLFGGFDWKIPCKRDDIWTHQIGTNVWNKLNIKLPGDGVFCWFGSILTSNEKYIILFVGDPNKIWILDIDKMEWILSKLKCPQIGSSYAILMDDKIKDRLLVFGYIRNHYLNDMVSLPMDLWNLISHWFAMEFVYLISRNGLNMYRINLDHILQ